tara:strand:- start:462 stop:1112 length:651 start_codon:yes stop_codon:yes gene_type:complete
MPDGGFDLTDAYAVETPDDNRDLYARWAATYESMFVADNGYVYHLGVVGSFVDTASDGDDPVLDVGCGTGLVGVALRATGLWTVDGLDLSAEMLREARVKVSGEGDPVYRHLHEGDLTATLDIPSSAYGAVVSSGTFTHGHVGPTAFDELYRITRPGGLFAVGINLDHFTNLGFADRFVDDVAAGRITEPVIQRVNTYEAGDHAGQLSAVAVFRTL